MIEPTTAEQKDQIRSRDRIRWEITIHSEEMISYLSLSIRTHWSQKKKKNISDGVLCSSSLNPGLTVLAIILVSEHIIHRINQQQKKSEFALCLESKTCMSCCLWPFCVTAKVVLGPKCDGAKVCWG